VYVDALVLNDGGNVLDALSVAARAALAVTRVYKVPTTIHTSISSAATEAVPSGCSTSISLQLLEKCVKLIRQLQLDTLKAVVCQ